MQNDETPALQADRAAVATLPIEIRGRHYEVPVAVHVRFVGMAEELSRNVAGQPFIRNLLGFAEHCISAAEEGEDYSVSRPMLDAMTTLGLMEKVGRGKWAPTPAAEQFVQVGNATPPAVVNGIPQGFRNMADGASFEDYRDQLAVGNLMAIDQMAFDNLLHDLLAAAIARAKATQP